MYNFGIGYKIVFLHADDNWSQEYYTDSKIIKLTFTEVGARDVNVGQIKENCSRLPSIVQSPYEYFDTTQPKPNHGATKVE